MQQTKVLIEFVKAAVLDESPTISKDVSIDWDALMDQASDQNVLAWVWDGVCKLADGQKPPRNSAISWGLTAQEAWNDYACQLSVLEKIVGICNQNQMRVLLLKGLSLSSLFPSPKSRSSSDIDIYLFDDYEKGNRLLSDSHAKGAGKHALLHIDGVLIENHNNFLEPNTAQKRKIIDYIKSSLNDVRLTPYGYYVLSPLANCLFLTFHTSKHFMQKTIFPLRNIVDFAMYMKTSRDQGDLSPNDCKSLMRQMGMEKCFAMLVFLSQEILGIDLSEYYCTDLPQNDKVCIKELLLDESVIDSMSPFKKCKYVKCVKRYMPRNLSVQQIVIGKMSRYLRWIFRVPKGVSLHAFLRRK